MEVNKKIVNVLIEDDTEILGNGQGHVMYRQYLPVLKYLNILKQYSIKSTFYIDMAHLLFLIKNSEKADFKIQAEVLKKTITLLLDNDMEIQLHIHSQWANAFMKDGFIYVTKKWNIGQLSDNGQKKIFKDCYSCLLNILSKANKPNKLISFKAGSCGLQPFNVLYNEFIKSGMKIILGPTKGLKINSLGIDYSDLESELFPYYCDSKDVNKIGENKEIVVIPMTPTYLNWLDLVKYLFTHKLNKFRNKLDADLDINRLTLSKKIKNLNPLYNRCKLNCSLKPFKTHLKINTQPFWYLKNTFNRSYKEIMNSNHKYKLLVIETHTKNFKNNFNNIDAFFKYLNNNYSNLNFITVSELNQDIIKGILKPISK